eukprot:scaffold2423_cov113-Isochrysis_galbana.AAC.1
MATFPPTKTKKPTPPVRGDPADGQLTLDYCPGPHTLSYGALPILACTAMMMNRQSWHASPKSSRCHTMPFFPSEEKNKIPRTRLFERWRP